MKRIVSIVLFAFIVLEAMGQYGNEWITFGQPWFRIPVGSSGLYKISHGDLVAAGLPGSPDPRTFRLYHRGIEQAIRVHGQDDGIFQTGDYIEFIGSGNDGSLDSTLYADAGHQPHRYYNLFSDTTAYFLTWGGPTGKRMTTFSAPATGVSPAAWHFNERLLILKDTYSGGRDYSDIQLTAFDQGEGWMGVQILQNQIVTYAVPGITETVPSGGKPLLEVLLTGRGPMVHHVELYAGPRLLLSLSFPGYESYQHEQLLEWSDIDASGALALRVKVAGGAPDRVSVGYIRLRFPQEVTMAGAQERFFILPPSETATVLLNVREAPATVRLFDVTDPAGVAEIATSFSTSLDAVVPASGERHFFATAAARPVAGIRRVTFREIVPGQANYVMITHPSLRAPAMGYVDPVLAYAEYRALPEGGGYDTLVVNIDQLYDQFNYGEPSPRAIVQFMKFLASASPPEYLFLVGKGLDVNYGYRRRPLEFSTYRDLVPTAGYPASDMAFTAGLGGIAHAPAVATGRLTATSSAEVASYFNKVREHEARPYDNLSRKKLLHLSGGIEDHEPAVFRSIMEDFATTAEGLYLGGSVKAIAKGSRDVKLINVSDEINNGLAMVTFFGHSAPNTTDFDIGMASDPVMGYNNKGKYPFLLMNGCDAGSYFLNATIFGEDWIKTPDRGAVGFIAHSAYGKLVGLQRYASTFYQVAFGDQAFINQGVGRIQQELARRYFQTFGTEADDITQAQQMVLLGDPAVRIFGAGKPDYAVDGEGISLSSFDGEPVTAHTDSFLIHIPVRNFGLADERQVRIEVRRQFNDQLSASYDTIVPGVLYHDTLSLVIRNPDNRGFGINVFSVTVDADEFIAELDEGNNTAAFEFFIPLNTTTNLYPYPYAIVTTPAVDLSFQYTDLSSTPREFLLEVDTTNTFDSGYKKQFTITAEVLVMHKLQLLSADTLAYYWRTRIADPVEGDGREWTVSSFTYIAGGEEGWAQVHFPQFVANPSSGLVKDEMLRKLRYEETVSDVAIRTFSAISSAPLDSVRVRINGAEFNLLHLGGACRDNTVNLIAFDRRSTQPYAGLNFKWHELLYQYGGRRLVCGREPYVINSFKPDELVTGAEDDLIQYIENVAEGDSVVIFNMGDAGFPQWPDAAKAALASFGVSLVQLADIQPEDGFVIFGRKGSPAGTAQVFRTSSSEEPLLVNRTIEGRFTSGVMSSVRIGPARAWHRFVPAYHEVEAVDNVTFSITGIRADGATDTLRTGIVAEEDLSFIDPDTYPYLRVAFEAADNVNLTAAQLSTWLVLYEEVPEGLVFAATDVPQEEVLEGDTAFYSFGFVNVSDKVFADSLSVRYRLVATTRVQNAASAVRIPPPSPGDTTLFTLSFPTASRVGVNDVEVFVNPAVVPEKSYDNNLLTLRDQLAVLGDEWDPVVDVTFDGRHIRNGEYVSTHPEILIRLWDEHPFMLKRDTTGILIFLGVECETECALTPVFFSRSDVSWHPATSASPFMIRFTPAEFQDGTYLLRVQASDASGNVPAEPFVVQFSVAHNDDIMIRAPYPNPFSMETVFEAVVTGEETGEFPFDLYIHDLRGILVTKISEGENGLHIGDNRIRWQGARQDGTALPNGVYLFRLVIHGSNGKTTTRQGRIAIVR